MKLLRHFTAIVLTITRPFRNHLRHSLCCLRKSVLKHDASQSELEMVAFNTALACYLIVQARLVYGEEPAFFAAITGLLPVAFWLAIVGSVVAGVLWARHMDCLTWRWRFSLAGALLWIFLSVFLWSSFWWANGKISIVHFLSVPILRAALFCNVRLSAERRDHSLHREKIPTIADDGESLVDCIKRGAVPLVGLLGAYLKWR